MGWCLIGRAGRGHLAVAILVARRGLACLGLIRRGVALGVGVLVVVLMGRLEGLAAEAVLALAGDPQGSALASGLRQGLGSLFCAPVLWPRFLRRGFLGARIMARVMGR